MGRRLYWGERISHSFQLDRAKFVHNVYNLANLKFLNSFRHEVGRRLCWGERISHSFQLDRAKGEMTSLQKWTMGERGLRRKDEHPFWTPPRKIRWALWHIYFFILIFSSTQDKIGLVSYLFPHHHEKWKTHVVGMKGQSVSVFLRCCCIRFPRFGQNSPSMSVDTAELGLNSSLLSTPT